MSWVIFGILLLLVVVVVGEMKIMAESDNNETPHYEDGLL